MYTITTEKFNPLTNTFTKIITEPIQEATVGKAVLFTHIGTIKPADGFYRHTINHQGQTIAQYNVACFDFAGYLQQLTHAATAKRTKLPENNT